MDRPAREPDFRALRAAMVAQQIAARGVKDERVLAAMRAVPREDFVPPALRASACDDRALEIGQGQTISQPYIVAYMLAALRPAPTDRALEVGTGSGYGAAVLARLVREVHTVECLPELASAAAARLTACGAGNVHVHLGDGTLGWPAAAPFDVIAVTAGGPSVPRSLLRQLALGGRLVIPIGSPGDQMLVRVTRRGDERFDRDTLVAVRFVPLRGAEGW